MMRGTSRLGAATVGLGVAAGLGIQWRHTHNDSVARCAAARPDRATPMGRALHVWGPAPLKGEAAAAWGRLLLEDECPRSIAWGAGAGVVADARGDLVAVRPRGGVVDTATRAGADARYVSMDASNAVFYLTTGGLLRRWDAFGARDTDAELLPGRVVTQLACGTSHCLAIDDGGLVHSWASQHGGARMGALGRPSAPAGGQHPPQHKPAPVVLPEGARAAQCACGDAHR
jgi:hypothetical protein